MSMNDNEWISLQDAKGHDLKLRGGIHKIGNRGILSQMSNMDLQAFGPYHVFNKRAWWNKQLYADNEWISLQDAKGHNLKLWGGIQKIVNRGILNQMCKGQLNSECIYEVIVSSKLPTKKLPRFLPYPIISIRANTVRPSVHCSMWWYRLWDGNITQYIPGKQVLTV